MSLDDPSRVIRRPRTKSRLLLLDVLRLGAALAVMAYHYVASRGSKWDTESLEVLSPQAEIASYGALGVQLFFIVSGFVILMSVWGRSVGSFAASRISRLFPAYWTAVLLCAFLFVVIAPGEFKEITVPQILVNLTMAQESMGVAHIDGVYWTLWIELLFYLTMGFLAWSGITYRKMLAFALIWPLLGQLALVQKIPPLSTILIPQYSAFFAMGIVLYLIYAYGHSFLHWALIGFNFAISGNATTKYFLPSMEATTQRELSSAWVWGILLANLILVAVFTTSRIRFMGYSWMAVAGALTYPLYLVHEYWGWWLIRGSRGLLGPWGAIILASVFSLVLAWLVYRCVEKPWSGAMRRWVENSLRFGDPKNSDLKTARVDSTGNNSFVTKVSSDSSLESPKISH